MCRSQLYHSFIETDTHYEYHVSAIRQEAEEARSMSRRIKKDHIDAPSVRQRWRQEVEFYKSIEVSTKD